MYISFINVLLKYRDSKSKAKRVKYQGTKKGEAIGIKEEHVEWIFDWEKGKFGGVTLLLNHSRGLSSSSDIIIPDYPSHPVSSVSLLASFGSLFASCSRRWSMLYYIVRFQFTIQLLLK